MFFFLEDSPLLSTSVPLEDNNYDNTFKYPDMKKNQLSMVEYFKGLDECLLFIWRTPPNIDKTGPNLIVMVEVVVVATKWSSSEKCLRSGQIRSGGEKSSPMGETAGNSSECY